MTPATEDRPYAEDEFALGAIAAAGNHDLAGDWGPADTLIVELQADAPAAADNTLDAVLEDSNDGVDWSQVVAFGQLTNAARRNLQRIGEGTPFGKRLRLRVTAVAGTGVNWPNVRVRIASEVGGR